MNERIKQLMDLAGIDVEAVENLGEMPTALKFAELIVRECAEVITETRWHLPPTQQQIAVGIKEHFGVNE
jgi:hypothetical protein